VFELAEGQVSKIEVGRPGKFRAKVGGTVELTPEKLSRIASGFDPDGYHKLKLGHKEIDTDTPDMGDVVGLEWDATKERLFAAVRPTESLVEKNRKGEFRRISMELGGGDDLPLRHISFLGAHRPAISGLAPVHLAADAPGEIFLAADGDEVLILADGEEEKPAPPAPTEVLKDEPLASTQENEVDRSKETKMAEEAVALAEEKDRNARLSARIKRAAEERVDAFLERHKDKIPMQLHKKGVKEVLTHFASKEGDDGDSIKLALPGDTTPQERSEYALVTTLLAELPPLVATVEKTELTLKGAEIVSETSTLPPVLASMNPDPEGDAYLLAAIEEQKAARAAGETIDFAEAARRIYAKRGDRG